MVDFMEHVEREYFQLSQAIAPPDVRVSSRGLKCSVCNFEHQEVEGRHGNFTPQTRHACSHGCHVIFMKQECPICWDETEPFVALPCGHGVCKPCFQRLGGRTGEAAEHPATIERIGAPTGDDEEMADDSVPFYFPVRPQNNNRRGILDDLLPSDSEESGSNNHEDDEDNDDDSSSSSSNGSSQDSNHPPGNDPRLLRRIIERRPPSPIVLSSDTEDDDDQVLRRPIQRPQRPRQPMQNQGFNPRNVAPSSAILRAERAARVASRRVVNRNFASLVRVNGNYWYSSESEESDNEEEENHPAQHNSSGSSLVNGNLGSDSEMEESENDDEVQNGPEDNQAQEEEEESSDASSTTSEDESNEPAISPALAMRQLERRMAARNRLLRTRRDLPHILPRVASRPVIRRRAPLPQVGRSSSTSTTTDDRVRRREERLSFLARRRHTRRQGAPGSSTRNHGNNNDVNGERARNRFQSDSDDSDAGSRVTGNSNNGNNNNNGGVHHGHRVVSWHRRFFAGALGQRSL